VLSQPWPDKPAARSLLLWGGTGADGRPQLQPVFIVNAPPALPARGGDHLLRGLDASGGELFFLRFDMPEIADSDGQSTFAYALSAHPGWADALASVTLSGPGGSVALDNNKQHRRTHDYPPGRAHRPDPGDPAVPRGPFGSTTSDRVFTIVSP